MKRFIYSAGIILCSALVASLIGCSTTGSCASCKSCKQAEHEVACSDHHKSKHPECSDPNASCECSDKKSEKKQISSSASPYRTQSLNLKLDEVRASPVAMKLGESKTQLLEQGSKIKSDIEEELTLKAVPGQSEKANSK